MITCPAEGAKQCTTSGPSDVCVCVDFKCSGLVGLVGIELERYNSIMSCNKYN